jgi:Spy/CpxP family protein refolding chaperone
MKTHRVFPLVILLTGLLAAPALADPPGAGTRPGMAGHPGMGMQGGMGMHGGSGMGMHGGMGMGRGQGLQPHNAAAHFLKMADALDLDDGQRAKLRKLRDAWIDNNASNEARLRAAQADLKALLFADTFDLKAVDAVLEKIGPIEGQLWRDYAQQLLEIKSMLNDDQRARLRQRMRRMGM